MVQSINDVLEERGTRYGVFMGQAQIAQSIHLVLEQGMKLSNKNKFSFSPDQLEAISMIVNKIARIYNGDPNYSDSWRDIAGYATLVADRLENEEQKLIEAEQDERDRTETTADSPADGNPTWEEDIERQRASEANGVNSRPTRQPELRRMPVRLEVQDGYHNNSSQVG